MTPAVTIASAADPAAVAACHAIRRQVFVEEQGIDPALEWDEDDARALHVLATADGRPVGCARAVFDGKRVKIGRMAVLPAYRGRGIGRALLSQVIDIARRRGVESAYLHAQTAVQEFYRRSGFSPAGEVFDEADIPHRLMQREI